MKKITIVINDYFTEPVINIESEEESYNFSYVDVNTTPENLHGLQSKEVGGTDYHRQLLYHCSRLSDSVKKIIELHK